LVTGIEVMVTGKYLRHRKWYCVGSSLKALISIYNLVLVNCGLGLDTYGLDSITTHDTSVQKAASDNENVDTV